MCGVVWCGVVWSGVVCVEWSGVVWWCGMEWCVWYGVEWCGVVVWCVVDPVKLSAHSPSLITEKLDCSDIPCAYKYIRFPPIFLRGGSVLLTVMTSVQF